MVLMVNIFGAVSEQDREIVRQIEARMRNCVSFCVHPWPVLSALRSTGGLIILSGADAGAVIVALRRSRSLSFTSGRCRDPRCNPSGQRPSEPGI